MASVNTKSSRSATSRGSATRPGSWQFDNRFIGIAPEQRHRVADALDGLGARLSAHRGHPGITACPITAGEAYLDQFVGIECDLELTHYGVGEAILTESNDGITVMRTRSQETDLSGGQHGSPQSQSNEDGRRTVAYERGPFDEVKIDLGAIVVAAAVGAPLVMWLVDGPLEWILLGGYGVGAGVWIYCRTRGVLAAADASRRERRGGP